MNHATGLGDCGARSTVSDSERLLLRQFRTVRGDVGNRNLATSVSLEGKGAQETCKNSTSQVGVSRHQNEATLSA